MAPRSVRPSTSALVLLCALSLSACRAASHRQDLDETPARTVEIQWRGVRAFPRRRLAMRIADAVDDLRRRRRSERAVVDDAAFEIESYYHSQGFAFAHVAWQIRHSSPERIKVRFYVGEGPRVVIRKIEFEGNRAFTDQELEALVGGPRSGLLETGKRYYVPSRIESLPRTIAGAYRARGFLRVRVSDPELGWNEERTRVSIHVRIEEGTAFYLRSIHGLEDLPIPAEERSALLKRFLDTPYTPRRVYLIRNAVREALRAHGYAQASVYAWETLDTETGRVELTIKASPGARVRIKEIEIRGNERTRATLIRRRLTLEPGVFWSSVAERESFRRLIRTGLFRRARLELETITNTADSMSPSEEIGWATLRVEVEETPAIELFVEPGYGSYELVRLKAGVRHRNVFGTGRRAHARFKAAVRAQNVVAGFTDPFVFGTDMVADLSGYWKRRKEPSFTNEEFGGELSFTRRFGAFVHGQTVYRLSRSRLRATEVGDPAIEAASERVDLSVFSLSAAYDRRDNPLWPLEGSVIRLGAEWGDHRFGSGLDFVRLRAAFSHHLRLTGDAVLSVRAALAVVAPTGDDEIPLQERLFLGGENTVRSFRQDRLGPKDADGDPTGGEGSYLLSAELRHRLWRKLWLGLFYDGGRVSERHEDLFEGKRYRQGVGVGVRYVLPIGPLRLDVGVNPNPTDDEDRLAVHFSVGLAF